MQWERKDKHYEQAGNYTVAAVRSIGQWRFVAWHLRTLLDVKDTAAEARAVCEAHYVPEDEESNDNSN